MKKTIYILMYLGKPCAVIFAGQENNELEGKLKQAIQEEVGADKDGQFSLNIKRMGDWGESTPIQTTYVNDGELVEDNEFSLVKTVSY